MKEALDLKALEEKIKKRLVMLLTAGKIDEERVGQIAKSVLKITRNSDMADDVATLVEKLGEISEIADMTGSIMEGEERQQISDVVAVIVDLLDEGVFKEALEFSKKAENMIDNKKIGDLSDLIAEYKDAESLDKE